MGAAGPPGHDTFGHPTTAEPGRHFGSAAVKSPAAGTAPAGPGGPVRRRGPAGGTTVTARWEARCRHVGPFLDVEPTGRWATVKCTTVTVFAGGRVVRARDDWDADSFLRQLRGEPPRPI